VIFGAAVRKNGEPSGAMSRRVDCAYNIGKEKPDSIYIPTGGVGKTKFQEAETMKKLLLNLGVAEDKIIPEEESKDTFASVINCSKILRAHNNFNKVYVVSDIYHIPRCRWLFYMLAIKTRSSRPESGLWPNGILKWSYFYFREIFALPYDTILMLFFLLNNAGSSKLRA
jgi:uncharacterized SAM-binding protein YcdF (DUF218 family)